MKNFLKLLKKRNKQEFEAILSPSSVFEGSKKTSSWR